MRREIIEKLCKSIDYLLLNLTLPVIGEQKYIMDFEKLKTHSIKHFKSMPDYEIVIKSDYVNIYINSDDDMLKRYLEKYLDSWDICDFYIYLKT